MNTRDLEQLEVRILKKLAQALREGFEPGYFSRGGPQDGDSYPDSFDAIRAATHLEREAHKIENEQT